MSCPLTSDKGAETVQTVLAQSNLHVPEDESRGLGPESALQNRESEFLLPEAPACCPG